MKKAIMAIAALAAIVAHADPWTDLETGITWIYTVSNGKASLGGGILSGTVDLSTWYTTMPWGRGVSQPWPSRHSSTKYSPSVLVGHL